MSISDVNSTCIDKFSKDSIVFLFLVSFGELSIRKHNHIIFKVIGKIPSMLCYAHGAGGNHEVEEINNGDWKQLGGWQVNLIGLTFLAFVQMVVKERDWSFCLKSKNQVLSPMCHYHKLSLDPYLPDRGQEGG